MIEINNLTGLAIDEKFLKKAAKIVLRSKKIDISIALLGEAKMQQINKKYRGKNKVTDVLSFPEVEEIIICPQEVKRNAKKFDSSFNKELARVLIHGILHLLGYSHEKMKGKEEYYLLKIK